MVGTEGGVAYMVIRMNYHVDSDYVASSCIGSSASSPALVILEKPGERARLVEQKCRGCSADAE